MKVRIWGARGSLAVSGPEYFKYGGNTSCVELRAADENLVVLDAGTGLRRLSDSIGDEVKRVDILLTHFHVDHLFGFGFFGVLFRPDVEVHVWGPATRMMGLRARLNRMLSPPLFPVRVPDLPSRPVLHEPPIGPFELPGLEVTADLVCHPGRTYGYRFDDGHGVVTYLPDHEPILGWERIPHDPTWVSGTDLAADADLLIHDAQYTEDEYAQRVGWGHSSTTQVVDFARLVEARHLLAFHHDPGHDDWDLDSMWEKVDIPEEMELSVAAEGQTHLVGSHA